MPEDGKTLIMKFGGAAVRTPASFSHIARLIVKKREEFAHVVIVVSAMGDMTDQLIDLAFQVHHEPPKREYDMLVSSGERISIALLAMALSAIGHEAVSFTGSQSGIITTAEHSDAKIIDVRPNRLLQVLHLKKIVIVAGFQGMSESKEITTLGRGGSDTTAVALGVALGAESVEFYKDVLGIYESDPKKDPRAKLFLHLKHQDALDLVEKTKSQVLHPRAIRLAMRNDLTLSVRSVFDEPHPGTRIHSTAIIKPRCPCYEYENVDDHHPA